MIHLLKRHPIPVTAFFRHSLVLTYAFPPEILAPLLPSGLVLDTFHGHAFLAIALVETAHLRPSFLPAAMGRSFFLSGYRIFTRLGGAASSRRGLRILRSDTDHTWMVRAGNLLTHYNYRLCRVAREDAIPYLGICLGLQVLFGSSEEAPGCAGLGVLEGSVVKLKDGKDPLTGAALKIPHIGWNVAEPTERRGLLTPAGQHFYFVHSFVVAPRDRAIVAATTEYGERFVSAIAYDNVFACQFHPEKSQRAGLALLERFLAS